MTTATAGDVLNRLCHSEQRSIVARLVESGVFVSWASASESALLRRMGAEEQEHVRWVIDLLGQQGEGLRPFRPDASTSNLHFLELRSALPQIIADKQRLIAAAERAAAHLAYHPEAAERIRRIARRHEAHLVELNKLAADSGA